MYHRKKNVSQPSSGLGFCSSYMVKSQEGRDRGKIGIPLWFLPPENSEENWNQSARQVHLLLLWQDQMKNRAVRIWHCGSCMKTVVGGDLDLQHHLHSHSAVCHQKTEGTERTVEAERLRLAINGVIYMTKYFIMALCILYCLVPTSLALPIDISPAATLQLLTQRVDSVRHGGHLILEQSFRREGFF